MFAAIVRSSSESVGDSETICWNCPITLRTQRFRRWRSRSRLGVVQFFDLGQLINGLNLHITQQLYPADAFGKDKPLWLQHPDYQVHGGQGADLVALSYHGRQAIRRGSS